MMLCNQPSKIKTVQHIHACESKENNKIKQSSIELQMNARQQTESKTIRIEKQKCT